MAGIRDLKGATLSKNIKVELSRVNAILTKGTDPFSTDYLHVVREHLQDAKDALVWMELNAPIEVYLGLRDTTPHKMDE